MAELPTRWVASSGWSKSYLVGEPGGPTQFIVRLPPGWRVDEQFTRDMTLLTSAPELFVLAMEAAATHVCSYLSCPPSCDIVSRALVMADRMHGGPRGDS